MIAFVLAQLVTPRPIDTPAPVRASETAVMARAIDDGVAKAKTLGMVLGVVVIDTKTGSTVERNENVALPLGGAAAFPLALLDLRARDAGALAAVPKEGAAIDADLAELGFDGFRFDDSRAGVGPAHTLADLLVSMHDGKLLEASDAAPVRRLLAATDPYSGVFTLGGRDFVVVSLVSDDRIDAKARAGLLSVARAAAAAAATQFPI